MSGSRAAEEFVKLASVDLAEIEGQIARAVGEGIDAEIKRIVRESEDIERRKVDIQKYINNKRTPIVEDVAIKLRKECTANFPTDSKGRIAECYLGASALNFLFGDNIFFTYELVKNALDERVQPFLNPDGTPTVYKAPNATFELAVFLTIDLKHNNISVVVSDTGSGFRKNLLGEFSEVYKSSAGSLKSPEDGHMGGAFKGLKMLCDVVESTQGKMYTLDGHGLAKTLAGHSFGDLAALIDAPGARILLQSEPYSQDLMAKLKSYPEAYQNQIDMHKLPGPTRWGMPCELRRTLKAHSSRNQESRSGDIIFAMDSLPDADDGWKDSPTPPSDLILSLPPSDGAIPCVPILSPSSTPIPSPFSASIASILSPLSASIVSILSPSSAPTPSSTPTLSPSPFGGSVSPALFGMLKTARPHGFSLFVAPKFNPAQQTAPAVPVTDPKQRLSLIRRI